MSNLHEAVQQALDWADNHGEVVFAGGGWFAVNGMNKWTRALRTAIKDQKHLTLTDAYNRGISVQLTHVAKKSSVDRRQCTGVPYQKTG